MIVFLFKGVRKELKIQPVIHATNSDYFHNLTGNKKETCMWNEDIDKIPPKYCTQKSYLLSELCDYFIVSDVI